MEKLRWLISDIFKNIRKLNILLGVKFENINLLKSENKFLYVSYYEDLFKPDEIILLKDILSLHLPVEKVVFLQDKEKILYPYPVLNSKFNNFITRVSIQKRKFFLEFFQKNNKKYYEQTESYFLYFEKIIEHIEEYTLEKVPLLEELYRYNQVILPFNFFEKHIKFIDEKWQNFLEKNKIAKFVDKIYFYF
jgi:hypothetical protein